MNYIIRLEVIGKQGKEEVLEALRGLSDGSISPKVLVNTIVDGIKVEEDVLFLFSSPKKL